MALLMILIITFCMLMYSVINNIFIGYALIICWLLFMFFSLKRGFKFNEILNMSYKGGKKSFVVIKIFLLIGAIISIWMAAGTIPSIVYYCLKYIRPNSFILSSFVISCMMSFLIGTSLGTVSTVGLPLIILARSGNVNLSMTAGAIIAGAYFGDRCSPMSSSAVLVANLTKTNQFINIKNMLRSSVIPMLLSLIFYYLLSLSNPLKIMNDSLSTELLSAFKIEFIVLLPAFIIIVMSLFKVKMMYSMVVSILCAFILSIVIQKHQINEVINFVFYGFRLDGGPLQSIIRGGGIVSMLKTSLAVFVSCSLAGLFEGIKLFDRLKTTLLGMKLEGPRLFGSTTIVSTVSAAFGCTQSIAIIMAQEIMGVCYGEDDNYNLALDLENSCVLIAALIPWNVAALVPTTTMDVSMAGYIPYAFYLYILPLVYLVQRKYFNIKKDVLVNTNI